MHRVFGLVTLYPGYLVVYSFQLIHRVSGLVLVVLLLLVSGPGTLYLDCLAVYSSQLMLPVFGLVLVVLPLPVFGLGTLYPGWLLGYSSLPMLLVYGLGLLFRLVHRVSGLVISGPQGLLEVVRLVSITYLVVLLIAVRLAIMLSLVVQ